MRAGTIIITVVLPKKGRSPAFLHFPRRAVLGQPELMCAKIGVFALYLLLGDVARIDQSFAAQLALNFLQKGSGLHRAWGGVTDIFPIQRDECIGVGRGYREKVIGLLGRRSGKVKKVVSAPQGPPPWSGPGRAL